MNVRNDVRNDVRNFCEMPSEILCNFVYETFCAFYTQTYSKRLVYHTHAILLIASGHFASELKRVVALKREANLERDELLSYRVNFLTKKVD